MHAINCINGLFCTKRKTYVEHNHHNSTGNGVAPPCYSLMEKNNEEGETLGRGEVRDRSYRGKGEEG